MTTTEDTTEKHAYTEYVPYGVTSYEDLEAYREGVERARQTNQVLWDFKEMADNIVYGNSDDVEGDLEALTQEFIARLRNSALDPDMDDKGLLEHLKKEVGKVPAFLRKLVQTDDEPAEDKSLPAPGMMVYKDAETGVYRWAAAYSNSFRDDDVPSEIIAAASHRQFVARVKSGEVDYPELWLWHNKDLRVGKADFVAVDEISDDIVFALAGGYFYEGMEAVAKALAAHAEPLGVSHGMPTAHIRRDTHDKSIITEHVTIEISPLTQAAAANKLAHFVALDELGAQVADKEHTKMITREDKEKLAQIGIDARLVDQIEERNATATAKATAAGVQRKSAEAEVEAEPAAEETETPVEDETPAEDEPVADAPLELTEREQKLVSEVVEGITKSVVAPLLERLDTVEKSIAEKPAAETEEKEVVEELPSSVDALITSIIGKSGARVRESDPLLDQKPVETKEEVSQGGMPTFLRSIIEPAK